MEKKKSKNGEKRKYIRFENGTNLKIKVKKRGEKRYSRKKIKATTKNLSAEGIFFTAEEKFSRGDLAKVELRLDSSKLLHLEGKVVWSHSNKSKDNKYLTGVRLFTLNKSDETIFLQYISDRITQRLSRYLHL